MIKLNHRIMEKIIWIFILSSKNLYAQPRLGAGIGIPYGVVGVNLAYDKSAVSPVAGIGVLPSFIYGKEEIGWSIGTQIRVVRLSEQFILCLTVVGGTVGRIEKVVLFEPEKSEYKIVTGLAQYAGIEWQVRNNLFLNFDLGFITPFKDQELFKEKDEMPLKFSFGISRSLGQRKLKKTNIQDSSSKFSIRISEGYADFDLNDFNKYQQSFDDFYSTNDQFIDVHGETAEITGAQNYEVEIDTRLYKNYSCLVGFSFMNFESSWNMEGKNTLHYIDHESFFEYENIYREGNFMLQNISINAGLCYSFHWSDHLIQTLGGGALYNIASLDYRYQRDTPDYEETLQNEFLQSTLSASDFGWYAHTGAEYRISSNIGLFFLLKFKRAFLDEFEGNADIHSVMYKKENAETKLLYTEMGSNKIFGPGGMMLFQDGQLGPTQWRAGRIDLTGFYYNLGIHIYL
ncbi:hypothetical protein JW935_19290 [candidate division KSB1 bacterium]|nr:hypothetical protein [candidate division KSB1 bacterium]